MLRKRRSKRHAKCSIKRYSKHSKTRIIRNMYRKKHKKTQRGGMFGFTNGKIHKEVETVASELQQELLACREELANCKEELVNYKKNVKSLLQENSQKFSDIQTSLTDKLNAMTNAYNACMDKYDSDTVKYNEAKTRMILKMKPDADITYHGYNSDWATFDASGKNEYVKKIVREYMEHHDLDRAVQEYRDMSKTGSSRFYGEYGKHNPTNPT